MIVRLIGCLFIGVSACVFACVRVFCVGLFACLFAGVFVCAVVRLAA